MPTLDSRTFVDTLMANFSSCVYTGPEQGKVWNYITIFLGAYLISFYFLYHFCYFPQLLTSNDWIYVVFVFGLLSLFKYVPHAPADCVLHEKCCRRAVASIVTGQYWWQQVSHGRFFPMKWCHISIKASQITGSSIIAPKFVQANTKEKIIAPFYWPFFVMVDSHNKVSMIQNGMTYSCNVYMSSYHAMFLIYCAEPSWMKYWWCVISDWRLILVSLVNFVVWKILISQ